ncbi:hypothetical protein I79_014892 [Cricetulus griseus]|uniref:Uncharacterized protein n=1 Tax=Cricetulus griseus TaxID=10029 RepID=G3HVB1_CRIGR|nr:hypothetical protein I79_014892 [Cricetulus griseus]
MESRTAGTLSPHRLCCILHSCSPGKTASCHVLCGTAGQGVPVFSECPKYVFHYLLQSPKIYMKRGQQDGWYSG